MRSLISALLVCWLSTAALADSAQIIIDQRRPRLVTVDYLPLPPTFDGFWTRTALIVRVRLKEPIGKMRAHQESFSVSTQYEAVVLEVLKSGGAVVENDVIKVSEFGGEAEIGGQHVRAEGKNALRGKNELVLFLNPSPALGGYAIAFGPSGAFELDDAEATIPLGIREYPEFKGYAKVGRLEFISLLHEIKKRH